MIVDLYRAVSPGSVPLPELRVSPLGVLVKRDSRREYGWPRPHWTVLLSPEGDRSHWFGQHLSDQEVAGWSVLVVRGA